MFGKKLAIADFTEDRYGAGYYYYDIAVRARATTDMLIGSVSQIALNHIGLFVVDKIQNDK